MLHTGGMLSGSADMPPTHRCSDTHTRRSCLWCASLEVIWRAAAAVKSKQSNLAAMACCGRGTKEQAGAVINSLRRASTVCIHRDALQHSPLHHEHLGHWCLGSPGAGIMAKILGNYGVSHLLLAVEAPGPCGRTQPPAGRHQCEVLPGPAGRPRERLFQGGAGQLAIAASEDAIVHLLSGGGGWSGALLARWAVHQRQAHGCLPPPPPPPLPPGFIETQKEALTVRPADRRRQSCKTTASGW